VANHFNSILILARFTGLHVGRTLEHFQENRNIISLCVLPVAVWVNFKSPGDPVRHKLGGVDWVL
jgi:hypothetical protein